MKDELETLKAFIVEDEALIAIDIQQMIEDAGHQVIGDAPSLDGFVNHPRKYDGNLYFVDLKLENKSSGFDVAQKIKENSDALVIYVTANSDLVKNDLGPADALIQKPLNRRSFHDVLEIVSEGEFDPPPSAQIPPSLMMADNLAKRWQM